MNPNKWKQFVLRFINKNGNPHVIDYFSETFRPNKVNKLLIKEEFYKEYSLQEDIRELEKTIIQAIPEILEPRIISGLDDISKASSDNNKPIYLAHHLVKEFDGANLSLLSDNDSATIIKQSRAIMKVYFLGIEDMRLTGELSFGGLEETTYVQSLTQLFSKSFPDILRGRFCSEVFSPDALYKKNPQTPLASLQKILYKSHFTPPKDKTDEIALQQAKRLFAVYLNYLESSNSSVSSKVHRF